MSYSTVISSLQALLKTINGYSDNNVSNGDYRVLGKGNTKAVVLLPGSFANEHFTMKGQRKRIWNIIVELWIKYQDDVQANSDIQSQRQLIIEKIDSYPRLNKSSGVIHAIITSGGTPEKKFDETGGGPHWIVQPMICEVQELQQITEEE